MDVQNAISDDEIRRKKKNAKKKKKDAFVSQKYKIVVGKGTHGKDARLFATEDVPRGEVIFTDEPFQWVPNPQVFQQFCNHCMASLTILTPVRACDKCKQAVYCGDACLAAASAVHQHECGVWKSLRPTIGVEIEEWLPHLVLRILIARAVDANARVRYERLVKMPSRLSEFRPEWLQLLKATAKAMLDLLPESMRIPIDDCVRLTCIVYPAASYLKGADDRNLAVGYGISDVLPAVRHSCRPNAVLSNIGTTVTVRAFEPIKAGSEVFSAQVELYTGREDRQADLRNTKFAECRCVECTTPLEKCRDRFFSGVKCQRKDCQGIYKSPTPAQFAECEAQAKAAVAAAAAAAGASANDDNSTAGAATTTDKGNDAAAAASQAPTAAAGQDVAVAAPKNDAGRVSHEADSKSATSTDAKAVAVADADSDASASAASTGGASLAAEHAEKSTTIDLQQPAALTPEELERNRRLLALEVQCDACGHAVPFERVHEVGERLARDYMQAVEYSSSVEPHIALRLFSKVLEEHRPLVHKDHAVLYLAHVQLILLGNSMQAHDVVFKNCALALESLDAHFTALNEETADVCWYMAESAAALARMPSASSKMLARYRTKARELYKRCGEIRSVIFGPNHPLTLLSLERGAAW